MAKFTVSNTVSGTQQAMTTTYKSIVSLSAVTGTFLCRGYVYEMNFGPAAAPNATDCSITWDVSRITATTSAATATTPLILDPGAATAANSLCQTNHTAEPTVTANTSLWSWSGNQRAGFRWFAYDYTARLPWPATAASGVDARALSSNYTGTTSFQIFFEE